MPKNKAPKEKLPINPNEQEVSEVSTSHEASKVREQPQIDKEHQEQTDDHLAVDTVVKPTPIPQTTIIPQVKDPVTSQIEKIMETGLVDAFKAMTPIQKQAFKIKGEETAKKIKEQLSKSKVKIKNIFKLLVDWLKLIPGVNRFFIEQEAKIKADKIAALKEHSNLST